MTGGCARRGVLCERVARERGEMDIVGDRRTIVRVSKR